MLVGRDRERSQLDQLLGGARDGRSGVLAIVGEAGIGKSALLAHAEERAQGGMRVLRARGVQTEAHIPFAGLFELLRPALGSLHQIPQFQAAALEGALALRPGHSLDRFAIGAATLSLLAAYAEAAPVAVLVDDAHALDGSSADTLLFAIRRLMADPIAVILTIRAGEASLLDGADVPTLHLRGLDQDAATELLRQRIPGVASPELASRLHRETGGNPLALVELAEQPRVLDDVALGGPLVVATRLSAIYAERYHVLPAPTREALVLVASSANNELALLGRAAASIAVQLTDLEAAETSGLISIREGRVEFRHPLARSAIYAAATAEQRRRMHRALASVLPDTEIDRRAWHLALAAVGPDDAVSSALAQAGGRARERSAYDVASRAFERAAQLAPVQNRQAHLLLAAADAAWLGGVTDRAAALLDQATRLADTPELTVSIDELRGYMATRRGPIQAAQDILLDAAERAATLDPGHAVVMLAEALHASFYAGNAESMLLAAERIRAVTPPNATGRTAFFSLIGQGMARIFSGEGERGATRMRQATQILEQSDELRNDPRLLAWAAIGPLWLREGHSGRLLIDRALSIARRQAAVGVLPFLLQHVALDGAASDRWAAAQASFHEAIDLARETGQLTELAGSLSRLAWLEARQGRATTSREHAVEALDLSRRLGLTLIELWSLSALGELELVLGHPEAALAHLEQGQAVLRTRAIGDADLSPAPELVELYVRLGRRREAAEAAELYERQAITKGQPWALARSARARGLVVAAEETEFERQMESALALHAQTPDVFEAARTHLVFGSHLRRSRQRIRAREQLRAAIDIFDRLGAVPWSELAHSELAATGETARRRNPATLNELTPQELQVALRIGEGRTTRETASALFLSPKTIEYHLRAVYRKLGIGSRSELVAVLDQLNAPPEPTAIGPSRT